MAPTTVATAARLMLERHLRWMLPVRDAAGRVSGVISRSDVLATQQPHAALVRSADGGRAPDTRRRVCDLMSRLLRAWLRRVGACGRNQELVADDVGRCW